MYSSKSTFFLALTLSCVAFGAQRASGQGEGVLGIPLGCAKCDGGPEESIVVTIRQASNGRYVDAHVTSGEDYRLVTRTRQDNDTQRWILTPLGNSRFTIQQASNRRYLDAHETSGEDYRLVTRTRQDNDTQRWILTPVGNSRYTIQQAKNGRYVDAHEHPGEDYRLVTRTRQNNDTQRWILNRLE